MVNFLLLFINCTSSIDNSHTISFKLDINRFNNDISQQIKSLVSESLFWQ